MQLDGVFAAGLVSLRIVGEQRRIDPDLLRDEGDHWCGRRLRRVQHATRMAKRAKLNGEAQPIARATPGPYESQIVGTEHIMAGHLGRVGRDREQADTLLGRQQGARGHVGLRLAVGGPFINCLPFNAILQQDIESRFARNCRARQIHSQTVVCECP